MKIQGVLWGAGLIGAVAVWAGPFSDVPRDDPLYETFRFLQEEGLLAHSLVKLPPAGALTRYEFAVATVDALDVLSALLAQAEAEPELAGPSSPPPEVQRCQAELRKLLNTFRPELQKLGLNIAAEMRKLDRFLKTVRSLRLEERAPQPTFPPPAELSRTVAASPSLPPEPAWEYLLAPNYSASEWRAPRDATELQDLLERTRGPLLSRAGGLFPGELSVRAALGGAGVYLIPTAGGGNNNPADSYAVYGGRATFGLWGHITAGLTYLRTEAEAGRGNRRKPWEGEVYGAEMRAPLGEYGMYLEYTRSQTPDAAKSRGRAFEAGVSGPVGSGLTVGAAYRSGEASFWLPGGGGSWGGDVQPTNLRGVRFVGEYHPRQGLRLLSSYEYYLPLSASPELGLDRTLANLEYGLNDRTSLSLGYEYIRRFNAAGLSLREDPKRWITAGLALDLADNVFFRLHYRRSMPGDRLRPTVNDDSLAVSELSVQF